MGKRHVKIFHQRKYTVANKHIKRCSTSSVIRERQIKTTVRYHYTPIRMAKTKTTVPNAGKDAEKRSLTCYWWEYKVTQPL